MKINQKERANRLIKATQEKWKDINVDINQDIGRKLISCFARDQIINLKNSYTDNYLKYFAKDNTKWNVLNLVMYFGGKGDPFYKAREVRWLGISKRKFDKIIRECIKSGRFIYADPIDATTDTRIKNIRPSEKLIISWSIYNINRMQRIIKNIKRFNLK